MSMTKTNAILKRTLNKLFTAKYTYKARKQKLRRESAVIGEVKMKYEC